jgi:hypothetical protein
MPGRFLYSRMMARRGSHSTFHLSTNCHHRRKKKLHWMNHLTKVQNEKATSGQTSLGVKKITLA